MPEVNQETARKPVKGRVGGDRQDLQVLERFYSGAHRHSGCCAGNKWGQDQGGDQAGGEVVGFRGLLKIELGAAPRADAGGLLLPRRWIWSNTAHLLSNLLTSYSALALMLGLHPCSEGPPKGPFSSRTNGSASLAAVPYFCVCVCVSIHL